jgi:SNF2 family DNA or RNA helicase
MALKNYVASTWMNLLKDLVMKNFMIEGTPIHNSLYSSYNYVLKD